MLIQCINGGGGGGGGEGFATLFYTTLLPFFVYGVVKSLVKKEHFFTINYTFLHLSSQIFFFLLFSH